MRCLPFLCLLAGGVAVEKVEVNVYLEMLCPFSVDAIRKPLNKTITAPGVAAIMDFALYPFGNAYLSTKECGGDTKWLGKECKCWTQTCGQGAKEPRPSDCFTGQAICQHWFIGECSLNRWVACAKRLTGAAAFEKYMPYAWCIVESKTLPGDDRAKACAGPTGMDLAALTTCHDGPEGDEAMAEAARATPQHPGVPYVLVGGRSVDPDKLLAEVCGAYKGPAPEGCRTMPAAESQVVV